MYKIITEQVVTFKNTGSGISQRNNRDVEEK